MKHNFKHQANEFRFASFGNDAANYTSNVQQSRNQSLHTKRNKYAKYKTLTV